MDDRSSDDRAKADLERFASYLMGNSTPPYGKDLFLRMANEARVGYSKELESFIKNYRGPAREQLVHDSLALPMVAARVRARQYEREHSPSE